MHYALYARKHWVALYSSQGLKYCGISRFFSLASPNDQIWPNGKIYESAESWQSIVAYGHTKGPVRSCVNFWVDYWSHFLKSKARNYKAYESFRYT